MTESRPPLRHPAVFVATWGGSGYLPRMPGTWGSLAALPFGWVIMGYGGVSALVIAVIASFVVGIFVAERYTALSGVQDPGPVVIDEVSGQWLALCVVPLDVGWFCVAFLAFRGFDIAKPWPISWFDRNLKGGFGVMADDIVAGIFAAIMLMLGQYLVLTISP